MQHVFPSYYKKFKCINKKCRHNCCIGWEIDIDSETLARYDSVGGEMGKRLSKSISRDGEAHFILSDGERCPFLNSENLCDIILTLGEESLCTICREHPRFHNSLPDRIESGLGLCCEEAARIIIGQVEPTLLETFGESDYYDEIIDLRDRVILVLQDRNRPISERIRNMLELCGATLPQKPAEEWCDIFLSLESLDTKWTNMLTLLRSEHKNIDLAAFDRHMSERQSEYEQLAVYIIYRYFANSFDISEASVAASFASLCYSLIRTLSALIYTKTKKFDFEDHIELIRMFSCEIEYSSENIDALFDILT